ncbi:MAG: SDR family oxidoreductase [Treponema sp.]|jgi:3-oxoacyl-[acyl-carrier protein] reductase|nr:SDR family oxidoreductase [Treponema sp.]
MNTNSFTGRKALVIGGSGGIGRAVALALAGENAFVTVHGGSSLERLENTINDIKAAGGKAEGFLCSADEKGAAEKILSMSPCADIIVCAWGPFKRSALEDTDAGLWEKMTLCNLAFPGTIVSLAISGMIERNYGRLLLLGGTNTDTIRGFNTTTAYSAAKTALGVLAKSAARIGGQSGVTCNVLCPGLTHTEYLDEEECAYNRKKSPDGAALETSEIARIALAIMKNPGLNGTVIPIDKGIVV